MILFYFKGKPFISPPSPSSYAPLKLNAQEEFEKAQRRKAKAKKQAEDNALIEEIIKRLLEGEDD